MTIKKSELYSSLQTGSDELRIPKISIFPTCTNRLNFL